MPSLEVDSTTDNDSDILSASDDGFASAERDSLARDHINGEVEKPTDMNEEYHTEESNDDDADTNDADSEASSEEDDSILGASASLKLPTLLPPELLKPSLPSPAHSVRTELNLPWNRMSRKQKRAERNRSRKAAKLRWDTMRKEAISNGVLGAGQVAQSRRRIERPSQKMAQGRVEKSKSRPQTSDREQLLAQRKRLIAQNGDRQLMSSRRPKKPTSER